MAASMRKWEAQVKLQTLHQTVVELADGAPLGLKFDDKLFVTSVDENMALRVAVGWRLLALNGRDLRAASKETAEKELAERVGTEQSLLFQMPVPAEIKPNADGYVVVKAPPGALGILLSEPQGTRGPILGEVMLASPIAGSVRAGMILCAIDGIDLSTLDHDQAAALLRERAKQPERELTLAFPEPERDGHLFCIALLIALVIVCLVAAGLYNYWHMGNERKRLADEALRKAVNALAGSRPWLSHDFIRAVVIPALRTGTPLARPADHGASCGKK